jgi:hypothetical protein
LFTLTCDRIFQKLDGGDRTTKWSSNRLRDIC